jgi:hypothetical protein
MKPRRTGTSVASILLLTAVVAIYAAGISSIRTMDEPPPAEVVAILLIVGLLFGTICGAFLGAIGGKKKRDIAIGALSGAFFGPPSILLLALPDALPVILVGGVILVAFAFAVRFFSPKDRAGPTGDTN